MSWVMVYVILVYELLHDNRQTCVSVAFFVNETATTEIYPYRHTLSRHAAHPVCAASAMISAISTASNPPPTAATASAAHRAAESATATGADSVAVIAAASAAATVAAASR